MKLIEIEEYLLLIDEETKIKEDNYYINIVQKEIYRHTIKNYDTNKSYLKLIIAYYPLKKESKELELPLLSDPFKEEMDVEELALKKYPNIDEKESGHFKRLV